MTYTDMFGRSPNISPEVRECLERHGLPPDELHHRFTPKITSILEMKIQGKPYRKIADEYGCVVSTVNEWLKEAGVKLKYPPGQRHNEVPAKICLPKLRGRPAVVLHLADEALVMNRRRPKAD